MKCMGWKGLNSGLKSTFSEVIIFSGGNFQRVYSDKWSAGANFTPDKINILIS